MAFANLISSLAVSRPMAELGVAVPAGGGAAQRADGDLLDFDLRDALAGITVRETSFKEYLDELRRMGLGGR